MFLSQGIRLLPLAVLTAALVAIVGGRSALAEPEAAGWPDSMAALGDSITQAANSSGIGDQPQNSWSTGTNVAVDSVYLRILAQNPAISGNNFNDSVSGAQMTDLNGQAASAVSQGVELVTILMGANDVCTDTEASMTPVATFQSQLETAMATLSAGLPDARIAVLSIPDVYHLWDILHDDLITVVFWDGFLICQSLLENAMSLAPEDVQRRANVRQRNIDFNTVLENVCAEYAQCRFDDNAGFNTAFGPEHVAFDYFHPSVSGQALAASVAWASWSDFIGLQLIQGDNDCDGDSDSVDALKGLQHVAAIGFSQEEGCPALGSEVASLFGDVDCDDDVDSVDALKILRKVAGLSVAQNEPCSDIGEPL